MLHSLTVAFTYVVPFLIVLTVLVFVHEMGHYLVARWNGVRVEIFSIGFGPELYGRTARNGTRWRLSAVPFGGYVKMYGDADAASTPDAAAVSVMSAEERAVSFHFKRLGQRAAIIFAGPAANFLFALVVLAGLYATAGEPYTPPQIGFVKDGGAAAAAGIKPGDTIENINGARIERFEDVQEAVMLNAGTPMQFVIRRGGADLPFSVTPEMTETTDHFGNKHHFGVLGVGRSGVDYQRQPPLTAVDHAAGHIWSVVSGTFEALGQMITGARSSEELGGPLRIAQMSGEVAQGGVLNLISFMALLSINLGLINLFPIPVLDGGHLLFYAAEAALGRPLGERAQEYGFRFGFALVLTLMVFATWNDIVQIYVRHS